MPRILALQKTTFKTPPPGAGTARRLPVTPDAIQSHGLDLSSVLSPQGTGLVWVGVRPGEPIPQSKPADTDARSTIVQVTNLGITVKDSPQSTLVFVTRLDNGEPVADARVTIINVENKQLWRGTTGKDGVALAPALPLRDPDDWYKFSFLVTAEKDGDVAYVGSDWNEGITPWEFDLPYQLWETTDILRGSVFTDRGVYKPGEEVHVKAIVRSDTPNGMRLLPAGSTLDIRVRDSRNKEVDRRTVTINHWSSAEWTWTVPADGTLGNYSIQAMLPGDREAGRQRRSAAGRPMATGCVRCTGRSSSRPIAGRTSASTRRSRRSRRSPAARCTRRSTRAYLFGSAMAQRPVPGRSRASRTSTVPAAIRETFPEDKYAFGYYPRDGRRADARVAGETVALDADGTLTLDLPTKRRCGLRLPLHVRGRRRGRLAPAHRQSRERSSCIRRRGRSACAGPTSSPTPRPARASTSSPSIRPARPWPASR